MLFFCLLSSWPSTTQAQKQQTHPDWDIEIKTPTHRQTERLGDWETDRRADFCHYFCWLFTELRTNWWISCFALLLLLFHTRLELNLDHNHNHNQKRVELCLVKHVSVQVHSPCASAACVLIKYIVRVFQLPLSPYTITVFMCVLCSLQQFGRVFLALSKQLKRKQQQLRQHPYSNCQACLCVCAKATILITINL